MTYNPANPNGQATAANSAPVVLASDQLPTAAAAADAVTNPTITKIGGYLFVWNGATWDRLPGTAALGMTVNTEMPAAAALADAAANPTAPAVGAFNLVWNGSTWDRLPGTAALGATVNTELPAAAAAADDMANPTAPFTLGALMLYDGSTWDRARVSSVVAGAVKTDMSTLLWGEDATNNVMRVEGQFSYTPITTATTTVIKASAGLLHAIIINKHVASQAITIYDNTSAAGTKIGTITPGAALLSDPPFPATYDCVFGTGLTIVTAGASDLTVIWR